MRQQPNSLRLEERREDNGAATVVSTEKERRLPKTGRREEGRLVKTHGVQGKEGRIKYVRSNLHQSSNRTVFLRRKGTSGGYLRKVDPTRENGSGLKR